MSLRLLLTIIFFGVGLINGNAQTVLTGTITDTLIGHPLPYSAAQIVGKNLGSIADNNGHFSIKTSLKYGQLKFSATGYKSKIVNFYGSQHYNVSLNPVNLKLNEIIIKGKRGHYHNKGNPAVALIRQVIKHKEENQIKGYQHVTYKEYEKKLLGYENPKGIIRHNFLFKKYDFVFNNQDTSSLKGKSILPIYIGENIYKKYARDFGRQKQTIKIAHKQVTFKKNLINNSTLGSILSYLYQDVDIYQNNLYIMTNSFLSPIAKLSPQFYKFFIMDTIVDPQGNKVVKLFLIPRTKQDLLFYGHLYVALNGKYSVVKADLIVPDASIINWVNSFRINLEYAPNKAGQYYLKKSTVGVEVGINDFGLKKIFKQAIYGERTVIRYDFNTKNPIPDSVFQPPKPQKNESIIKPDSYWVRHRPITLSKAQKLTYVNMDSLKYMHSFNNMVSWIIFITGGYKNIGPLEVGTIGTFVSFNSLEGFKPGVGARTTPQFSKRFYLSGNTAYGFGDHRLKYFVDASYAFNKVNPLYGYPQHFLKATYAFDTQLPGHEKVLSRDNTTIFESFQTGNNQRYFYNRFFRINYVNELIPHLRFNLSYEHRKQSPAGHLTFVETNQKTGQLDTLPGMTTAGFGLKVRWAPHEQFLKGRGEGRTTLPNKYPIFELHIKNGIKGLTGGQYDFQKYTLSIKKRFFLSQLGHADVVLKGGYLVGKVPYPLLFIPRANQSYIFHEGDFNMMNYLEFISDHYADFKINYHMYGFLLNKIPLIKQLHLREVAGFKIIYGGLRSENSGSLSSLPPDNKGRPTIFSFGKIPYMEFNVGVENILNIFRVDYVHRLTYRNHPGISKDGFRVSMEFKF